MTSSCLSDSVPTNSTPSLLERCLTELASEQAEIAVISRDVIWDFTNLMHEATVGESRWVCNFQDARDSSRERLRQLQLKSAPLETDIVNVIELFGQLFQRKFVQVRLEVSNKQSCPKFHCDNVFVRLLVTYFGPTTEYIKSDNPQDIHRVPLNSLVFLKGHKHPHYQDRVLHRSPPMTHKDRRLTLVLDFADRD